MSGKLGSCNFNMDLQGIKWVGNGDMYFTSSIHIYMSGDSGRLQGTAYLEKVQYISWLSFPLWWDVIPGATSCAQRLIVSFTYGPTRLWRQNITMLALISTPPDINQKIKTETFLPGTEFFSSSYPPSSLFCLSYLHV
jgi:hypothetical protein